MRSIALVAGLLLAVIARGDALSGDTLPPPDSSDVVPLKEVLIVATRVPDRLSNITLSVSKVGRSELRGNAINDAPAIFRNEPGIEVRSYSGARGVSSFGIWGSGSAQVLMMVDGHPVNNPILGTPDLGLIPLAGLEAVEVARGAGSSLYGANAMGGVVDFISRSPASLEPGRWNYDLQAGLGSNRTTNLSYFAGSSFGRLGIEVGSEYDHSSGTRSNSRSSDYAAMAGIGFIGFHPLDRFQADLRASFADRDLGLPGPQPSPDDSVTFGDSTASSLHDHETDRSVSVRSNISYQPSDWLSLDLRPDYSFIHTRFWMLSRSAPSPDSIKQDDYIAQSLGGGLLATLHLPAANRVVLGYDGRLEHGTVVSEALGDWQANSPNHGLWTELVLNAGRIVIANVSARYDINPGYQGALNPGLGIAVPLGKRGHDAESCPLFKLRGNIGTAFRAPTLSDRYWSHSGDSMIRPEHGLTIQAGGDLTVGGGHYDEGRRAKGEGRRAKSEWCPLSLSATGFYRFTRDLISWFPDTGIIWRPANVDSTRHIGAELSLRFSPIHDLDFRITGTYLHATQVRKEMIWYDWFTGEARYEYKRRGAAFVPPLSLVGSGSYRLPFGTQLVITTRYRGERSSYYQNWDSLPTITVQTKRLPSYLLFDANVGHRFGDHWEIGLRVDNLTNVHYSEQFGNTIKDLNYPMPGRRFAVTLRWTTD
jgi:outer membrane cobalamin receptor